MTTCVRIEILDNGYTVTYDDPEVRAKNRTSDSWVDPSRTRVYSSLDAMKTDLDVLLPLLKPEPATPVAEFSSAIDQAFADYEDNN